MRTRWQAVDDAIRTWWDGDMVTAHETDIRCDEAGTLLYLSHPYSPAAGSLGAFPELYGWDTYFINMGMLAHGRHDLVRHHIINQLSMIERFGMVLNGNRTFYLTRSQPPLLPQSVWRYFEATSDFLILHRAYEPLRQAFFGYWNAEHHQTPTGLATNRDLGDPGLRAELAAEAETGLDFTSCFGGDVRDCVPLITNCILVRYAAIMEEMATRIGLMADIDMWKSEQETRAKHINNLCWNDEAGFYFEYNYVREEQIPVRSLSAYWAMWAGVADASQCEQLAASLVEFEHPFGLTFTDQVYEVVHPEFTALQWSFPVGWAPMQIMVASALTLTGYDELARRVSKKFLALLLDEHERTGHLWEKYNVVDGSTTIPVERSASVPFHGWTAAAVVLLGRLLYE